MAKMDGKEIGKLAIISAIVLLGSPMLSGVIPALYTLGNVSVGGLVTTGLLIWLGGLAAEMVIK